MKRNHPIFPVLFIIVLLSGILCVFAISCTQNSHYKYYENPHFSFEYPSNFTLIEDHEETENQLDDCLEVKFTGWRRSLIEVFIQRHGTKAYGNASEKFDMLVNDAKNSSNSYTISKMMIDGIQADYLMSVHREDIPITISETVYLQSELSFRTVVFDYSGYIWEVSMYWDWAPSESPIIQEDFEHIIDTFKIKE